MRTPKLILYLSTFLFIAGCSTERKARREIAKLHELAYKHRSELAKDCAALFPVQDRVLPGRVDTLISHDTTSITVPCPPSKAGETVYVKVPTVTTRTLTVTKHDTILRRDVTNESVLTAQVRIVRDSLVMERTQHKVASKQRNNWMWVAIGLGAALVTGIVLKLTGRI